MLQVIKNTALESFGSYLVPCSYNAEVERSDFFCGKVPKLNLGYISDLSTMKVSIFNTTDITDHLIHHIFGQVICQSTRVTKIYH